MSSFLWKKKAVAPDIKLPERDEKVLKAYTAKVKKFDEMFKLCCCWIGYDILLEFIPIFGKVVSLLYALSLYRLACTCNLPRQIQRRMLYHISVDFLLGLIPILGILLDMLYRAHSKNLRILRKYLYERARLGSAQAEKEALNTIKDGKPMDLSKRTSEIMMEDDQLKQQ